MKKPIKNKQHIGIIVVSAAVLSMGSVGFASWIISGGDSKSIGSIGVEVATVKDERITISNPVYTYTCGAGNENDSAKTLVDTIDSPTQAYVVFGPKSDDKTGLIQAENDGNINDVEHLSVSFQFTLSSTELPTRLKTITITPKYPTLLTDLASSNYIINPSAISETDVTLFTKDTNEYGTEITILNSSENGNNGNNGNFKIKVTEPAKDGNDIYKSTVDITANWAWGSVFSNTNPASLDTSADTIDSVLSNINALSSSVSAATDKNVSFIITANSN